MQESGCCGDQILKSGNCCFQMSPDRDGFSRYSVVSCRLSKLAVHVISCIRSHGQGTEIFPVSGTAYVTWARSFKDFAMEGTQLHASYETAKAKEIIARKE